MLGKVRELQLQMGIDSGDLVRGDLLVRNLHAIPGGGAMQQGVWAGGAAGCLHLFEGRPCAEGHTPSVKTSSRVPPGHT